MSPAETHYTADTKLQRIAWLSARDASKRFDNVMHLFSEESLAACFQALEGKKAVGADGVTKAEYGAELECNLAGLVERMKRMGYRPGPVREVQIPKAGTAGATRTLGISSVEDKVVQGMVRKVLEAVYEPVFMDSSYGFRPGRGPHDAVRALHQYLYRHEVESVIDVDIARFFDTIDRRRLLGMLSQKVTDRKFLRYVTRLMKAGVLREGELKVSTEGVVQGSACSPVLANVYAHHVLDEWFERTVKRHCKGEVELFRYADDLVICCQYARDARIRTHPLNEANSTGAVQPPVANARGRQALVGRLGKFGLTLNEAKTRLVPFSRRCGNARGRPRLGQEPCEKRGLSPAWRYCNVHNVTDFGQPGGVRLSGFHLLLGPVPSGQCVGKGEDERQTTACQTQGGAPVGETHP